VERRKHNTRDGETRDLSSLTETELPITVLLRVCWFASMRGNSNLISKIKHQWEGSTRSADNNSTKESRKTGANYCTTRPSRVVALVERLGHAISIQSINMVLFLRNGIEALVLVNYMNERDRDCGRWWTRPHVYSYFGRHIL